MCHTNHRYAKENNKYMKDYDKNKETSFQALGGKQLIWMGNVAKVVCRQFQVG